MCYRLIGMFEQNNVGVRVVSPLATTILSLPPHHPNIQAYLDAVKNILENLEGIMHIIYTYYYKFFNNDIHYIFLHIHIRHILSQ
jgi:hypothetical protein